MKKQFLNILFSILCLSLIVSCGNGNSSSKFESSSSTIPESNYAIYYNRPWKFDIYCWEIDKNDWRCGLIEQSYSNYPYFAITHMQHYAPATIEKMREIISTYSDEIIQYTAVFVITYPYNRATYHNNYDVSEETIAYLRSALGLPETYILN